MAFSKRRNTISLSGGSGATFPKRRARRGGENNGGRITIRLGNKPPLYSFILKPALIALGVFFAFFLFVSCAARPYAKVDGVAAHGNYQTALELLEKHKKSLYNSQDAVLYYLDKGALSHYAGNFDDSISLLQNGERAIAAAFTKSVMQEIGAYLANDAVQEYAGEDYEDIYIKALNALNYYHKDDLEGALVEIRGMNNKLQYLSAKYAGLIDDMRKKARQDGKSVPDASQFSTAFANSALARYLGMLFYRGEGKPDDVRIDYDGLRNAFADAPAIYNYAIPASVQDELSVPAGKARLNVLAFAGLSPVKEESVLRIPLGLNYIKVALPVLTPRASAISRIDIVFDNGMRYNLELLENIEAIARETFKAKEAVIYTRSIIRATVKGATAAAAGQASRDSEDVGTSILLGVFSLGAQIFAEASEVADLRISRYFPSKVYVTGITLDPGAYSFSVNYYDARGNLIESFYRQNVVVKENKLNLTEVVCVK
jgi:hypothetical protein